MCLAWEILFVAPKQDKNDKKAQNEVLCFMDITSNIQRHRKKAEDRINPIHFYPSLLVFYPALFPVYLSTCYKGAVAGLSFGKKNATNNNNGSIETTIMVKSIPL